MAKLKTGRHTGAIKAARQAEKRAIRNTKVRRTIKSAAKEVLDAAGKKDVSGAAKLLPNTASLWDKAAKTGVIHWKTAARKKSRLAAQIAKASA